MTEQQSKLQRECVTHARCFLLGWISSLAKQAARTRSRSKMAEVGRLVDMDERALLAWYASYASTAERWYITEWLASRDQLTTAKS